MVTPDSDFGCDPIQKDMNLVLKLRQQLNMPLPAKAATNEYLLAANCMGTGHYDYAIIFDMLGWLAGIDEESM
jgi:3-hydroxyisobutyrate dehydrogenase-like beta-hydroxyacid dehydrogenase